MSEVAGSSRADVLHGGGADSSLRTDRTRRAHVRVTQLGAQLLLVAAALLLLLTGLTKAFDPTEFEHALSSQRLLAKSIIPVVGLALPIIEIVVAGGALVALTCGAASRWPGIAALLVSFLFLAFMGYAAALTIMPPPEPSSCGCGIRTKPISDWSPLVAKNGVCSAVLGGVALVLSRRPA
jgi:hypothetical protein